MKGVDEFVEAALNYKSAKEYLIDELCSELHLSKSKIKSVEFETYVEDMHLYYKIIVNLVGRNRLTLESLKNIEGLTIVTPNILEFDCGVVDL